MAEFTMLDAPPEALPLHMLNAVNRELTSEVASSNAHRDRMVKEISEHKQRLRFLREHLQNVMAETQQSQALVQRKQAEFESQEHRAQLTRRECAAMRQRNIQLQRNQEEYEEKISVMQTRILQGHVRLSELKSALSVNEEQLEQWDLARRHKEEDEVVIARYRKADEAKVKELTATIERLEKISHSTKYNLEEEVLESRAVQVELDRCAEEYTRQQRDRENLLNEWEQAIKTMQLRDQAILAAAEQYSRGLEWVDRRKAALKAFDEELEEEVSMTAQVNSTIKQQEAVAQKYRDDVVALDKLVRDLDDEVDVMRESMQRSMREREGRKARLKAARQGVMDKEAAVKHAEAQKGKTIERLQLEMRDAQDLEQQTQLISKLLLDAQSAEITLEKEEKVSKDKQYQATKQLHAERQRQKDILSEISGSQAQARTMKAKISQLDGESFRQQELVYNVEFSVQQMERKVSRAKGERSVEERKELHETIEQLQHTLAEGESLSKAMQEQVKRVDQEFRKTTLHNERLIKERQRLSEALLEINVACESCQIERRHLQQRKNEILVQDDVHQLQLERLKKRLLRDDGKRVTLEVGKEQLMADVLERELAIDVHQQLLRLEIKLVEEERKKLVTESLERGKALNALKNRHAIIESRVQTGEEQLTPAQLIVRAAKTREELQRKGDRLDNRVKKSERELRKLEKAIAVLRDSNSHYRHLFDKVKPDDEEMLEQQQLQQRTTQLKRLINRRTAEAADFDQSQAVKARELDEWAEEKAQAENTLQIVENECRQIFADTSQVIERTARYDAVIDQARATVDPVVVQDVDLMASKEQLYTLVERFLEVVAATEDEGLVRQVEATLTQIGVIAV